MARQRCAQGCSIASWRRALGGDCLGDAAAVRRFLQSVKAALSQIAAEGIFAKDHEVILSAGGSAYVDLVALEFAALQIPSPVPVLRSGCYITGARLGDFFSRQARCFLRHRPADPTQWFRHWAITRPASVAGWKIFQLSDQHAFMRVPNTS